MAPACAQHLRFLARSQQAAAQPAGEAGGGQGGRAVGGRGCARACQRSPGIVYDVRPMSHPGRPAFRLLRAGCGWRLDGQAGLPPGPPGPVPIHPAVYSQACPGTVPPLRVTNCLLPFICHSLSFPVSVFSAFWFLRPCVPSVSVPSCPGSLSISPASAPPCCPRGCRSPCICSPLPPSL